MAINYGARQEILAAMRAAMQCGESPDAVDEEYLASLLDTAGQPDPDLMIRTSGELRISNFLLYQLAYTELYFTDTYWPDFDEVEYIKALKYFESRDRRYGGV
jgi:undecaprenyl diphosphate synthase